MQHTRHESTQVLVGAGSVTWAALGNHPSAALTFNSAHGRVGAMSVRMRHTQGHTGNRRSHHALSEVKAVKDASSGNLRLPHRLDETTGMYRGKQLFTPKTKTKHAHVKGPSTATVHEHPHEHAHAEHANAEAKSSKGVSGKVATGGRPKARSGMGGQAS